MGRANQRRARARQCEESPRARFKHALKHRSPSGTPMRINRRQLTLALFGLVMVLSLAYIIHYEHTRREILRENESVSALYDVPELPTNPPMLPTDMPATPTASPTPRPTASTPPATPSPRPTHTETATAAPTPTLPVVVDIPLNEPPTPSPTPTTEPTEASTSVPSPSGEAPVAGATSPKATPDADTLVMALETPPPVQESFQSLLKANPETVGFLTIDDVLTLPVVQRPYDNEYYLTHNFDLEESIGGTLFLDGANLLSPEDDCLIVYGHNMRNGTMFQPLSRFEKPSFLRKHPLVRFDTIYENRVWVPFAALTLTADPDSDRYLDIRQFTFDELGFDLFVTSLRALSAWQSPVEVEFGDPILLLVTCEYTHNNGRFVLALRAQRPYESELQLRSQVQATR